MQVHNKERERSNLNQTEVELWLWNRLSAVKIVKSELMLILIDI
jgi:hypothetical protein